MVCFGSCFVSIVFLVGMIYFYYMADKSKTVSEYKKHLSKELKQRYQSITRERLMISYQGYALGLILSILIIFYNLKQKEAKINAFWMVCIVLSTSFVVNYFYYILSPKSDWMLNHMHSPKETQAWVKMYKQMQFNYHMGIFLGIVAVGVFGFAFRNS
jgi:uncharacterized protein YacL